MGAAAVATLSLWMSKTQESSLQSDFIVQASYLGRRKGLRGQAPANLFGIRAAQAPASSFPSSRSLTAASVLAQP